MRIAEAIEAVYAYRGLNVKVQIKKGSTDKSRAHTQGRNDFDQGNYNRKRS